MLWRECLKMKEKEWAFFHSCPELIGAKLYNRLYRGMSSGRGEIVFYNQAQKRLYLRVDNSIVVSTDSYYDILLEIFVNRIYLLPPQLTMKKFVVFDVGMNRGYASLYFANMENCEHVYGFELLPSTYEWACENVSLNSCLQKKITMFNYGLWNKDDTVNITSDGIDGHTRIAGKEDCRKVEKAQVRKASDVFAGLLETVGKDMVKVLKIDVEGAEYEVLANLYEQELMEEFDVVIGEYHNGMEPLMKYMEGFDCVYKNESVLRGIGDMTFVKKRG